MEVTGMNGYDRSWGRMIDERVGVLGGGFLIKPRN